MIRESYSDFRSWPPPHPINNEASLIVSAPQDLNYGTSQHHNIKEKVFLAPYRVGKIITDASDRGSKKNMVPLTGSKKPLGP